MSDNVPFFSLGGLPLVSAMTTISEFTAQGVDCSAFYGRANSYRCAIGPEPGQGWVLMQAKELAKLDSRLPHDLVIGINNKQVAIKKLAIKYAQRVLETDSDNPDGLMLVELTDVRYFLKQTFINKRYNLDLYCTEEDLCEGTLYTDLGPNTPWLFNEICRDIWSHFSDLGGFFSDIGIGFFGYVTWDDSVINGTLPVNAPKNLRFEGVSAWDALASLCQQNGFYLRYDPLVGNVLIMKIGFTPDPDPGSDGTFETGFGGSKNLLPGGNLARFPATPSATVRTAGTNDELEQDTQAFIGVPFVPESVTVMFQNNGEGCDSTCDVNSNTGRGWYHEVEKTAATIKATTLSVSTSTYDYLSTTVPGTTVTLYSTTFARYDSSTATTPVNASTLDSVAVRMATDYYRTLGLHSHARLVFGGIKEVIPGPGVTEVCWREIGDGLKTEIARWPIPVGLMKPPKLFPEGSRATQWCKFTIDSYDETYGYAICTVWWRPCGVSRLTDESDDKKIYVYDASGCMFNEDPADLVGRWGDAVYGYFADDEYKTCYWIVTNLCCPA